MITIILACVLLLAGYTLFAWSLLEMYRMRRIRKFFETVVSRRK